MYIYIIPEAINKLYTCCNIILRLITVLRAALHCYVDYITPRRYLMK